MYTEKNKEIIRRFYLESLNLGNLSILDELLDNNYFEVHDGKKYSIGIEGAKEHMNGVRDTYPDINMEIDQQIAEGDWVVTCYTLKGTHKGVWMNIKPTGKLLVYTGVNVDRVVDGKIIEHGGAANMFGPLLEAGAIKLVTIDDI